MSNLALGRTEQAILTNKSGGSVAQGDVVIIDSSTAASFTTTTTSGYTAGRVGVVLEPAGIANNSPGMIAFSGYVPKIALSGSASLGDLVKTHTVAKQGVRHAAPAVAGDFAQVLGTGTSPAALLLGAPIGGTITTDLIFIIGDGVNAISTGVAGDIFLDFACTITGVTMLADASGSIVVDIWKDTYANYPPTVADTITASALPTISTATKSQDTTLTGWTVAIPAGSCLRFNVNSVTTIKRLTLALKVTVP